MNALEAKLSKHLSDGKMSFGSPDFRVIRLL